MRISDRLVVQWVDEEPPVLVFVNDHSGAEVTVPVSEIVETFNAVVEADAGGDLLVIPDDGRTPGARPFLILPNEYVRLSIALGYFHGVAEDGEGR